MLDTEGIAFDLDALAVSFERQLGGPPERSAEAAAELIDDHFLRISTWMRAFGGEEYRRVEWVHPSVRDLVIDHLMGDAAARREFLGKAGIDGVMLALSSEGGARGERLFPLLGSEEDWQEMIARVGAMAPDLAAADNERLAALLADTARLAGTEEGSVHADELIELTRAGLEALSAHWTETAKPLDNGALRSFYRASETLLPPVPGPDLRPTWTERIEMITEYGLSEIDPGLQYAEEWTEMVELLHTHEPMWLVGLGFPEVQRPVTEEVLELIEREDGSFQLPDVEDDDDPSEYLEAPPDLEWMTTAEGILGKIGELDPQLTDRAASLPGRLDQKASEWQEYGRRHESVSKRERGESDDYEERPAVSAEEFDVRGFFADL
jgi:hypothetical protein